MWSASSKVSNQFPSLGDFSTQEEDIHLVIRMQHMPRIREVSDLGANRRQIMEKYPSPYEWPEPNVLGRLDQLGIQPRFWNPWISMCRLFCIAWKWLALHSTMATEISVLLYTLQK